MRIETRFNPKNDKFKKGSQVGKSDRSFLDIINDSESKDNFDILIDMDNITDKDMKDLAGLIGQTGDDLSQNPSQEQFLRYKKMIKVFINAVQKNFEVVDTISRIKFNKQNLYKTIGVIDENLHQIAQLLLSNEKNRISYLKLVNNIKGLIIDLTL
jgi:uncharacterized protein YaaR (DUF327 family)